MLNQNLFYRFTNEILKLEMFFFCLQLKSQGRMSDEISKDSAFARLSIYDNLHIFSYLCNRDVLNVALVCRHFEEIVRTCRPIWVGMALELRKAPSDIVMTLSSLDRPTSEIRMLVIEALMGLGGFPPVPRAGEACFRTFSAKIDRVDVDVEGNRVLVVLANLRAEILALSRFYTSTPVASWTLPFKSNEIAVRGDYAAFFSNSDTPYCLSIWHVGCDGQLASVGSCAQLGPRRSEAIAFSMTGDAIAILCKDDSSMRSVTIYPKIGGHFQSPGVRHRVPPTTFSLKLDGSFLALLAYRLNGVTRWACLTVMDLGRPTNFRFAGPLKILAEETHEVPDNSTRPSRLLKLELNHPLSDFDALMIHDPAHTLSLSVGRFSASECGLGPLFDVAGVFKDRDPFENVVGYQKMWSPSHSSGDIPVFRSGCDLTTFCGRHLRFTLPVAATTVPCFVGFGALYACFDALFYSPIPISMYEL